MIMEAFVVGVEYPAPARMDWPRLELAALYTCTDAGTVTQILHLKRPCSVHWIRAELGGLRVVPLVVGAWHQRFVRRYFRSDRNRIIRAVHLHRRKRRWMADTLRTDAFGEANLAYRADRGSEDTTDDDAVELVKVKKNRPITPDKIDLA